MDCIGPIVISIYFGFFIGIFTVGAFRKEFRESEKDEFPKS